MKSSKLPPLKEVDEDLIDHGSIELSPIKCKHEIKLITSTQARCTKCTAGWTGPNAHLITNS